MLKLVYWLGIGLQVSLGLVVLNHMLKFAHEGNSQSKLPYLCLITKSVLLQWVEIDFDDVKSLTSKLSVQPNSSWKYDLAPRGFITTKEIIAKYDALLLKTLQKIQSTHNQLEKETKVFKSAYALLQHELATFDLDVSDHNDKDAGTKDDEDWSSC